MKERIKGAFTKKKIFHFLKMALFVVALSLILLSLLGTVAHATGLVDDTINAENLYSKYPLSNYQLDFYVDNSWSWLPWNWLDGIGKSVQYGLYCITNFVWTISLYLSNATGYVVQEAYKLDFINDMADSIGQSIQTLAGVTQNGFSSSGFYVGFLLLIILVVGLYVAYTGLIKRETSKALHAVINFVVVFVLSASFIAYAPDYIKKIKEFSSDISTASLDLGTKIMLPNSDSEGKDSVDLIRDSLFSIQVEQPWLLLQFGNSNAEEIGADRVEALVSVSPEDEDGKTREEVVKTEIEDNDNNNLTIPQVVNRLGMVFFLLFFNLGITIFVFLLTGMMLFSQILFIIFAMFLPISFLLSMIPSYESMAKQAIVRVFNTIMTRAGITLIVTVAFSISSMFYNISTDYPFFMVAFLQIVCFAGIYMKLGDLMSMFSLNAGDSQNMGRRIFRRPYLFMRHRARRMERRLVSLVIVNLLGIPKTLFISLNFVSIGLLIIYFLTIYVLVLLNLLRRISKMTIRDFLYFDKQNEKKMFRDSKKRNVIFVLSIILGVISLFLWNSRCTMDNFNKQETLTYLMVSVIMLIISIYGISTTCADMFLTVLLKNKKMKYQNDNLFVARTFASKARTMSFTFGTLSMLILTSLLALNYSSINKASYDISVNLNAPYDVQLFDDKQVFDEYIRVIEEEYTIDNTIEYDIYKEPNHQVQNFFQSEYYDFDPVLKLSDYNRLLELRKMPLLSLNDNEYYIVTNSKFAYEVEDNKDIETITVANKNLKLKGYDTKSYWNSITNTGRFVVVLPDKYVQGLEVSENHLIMGYYV